MRTSRPLACLAGLLLALPAAADATKAEKTVKGQLDKYKAPAAPVKAVTSAALRRVLPEHQFFEVIFRQYPLAVAVPPPLKHSCLFAVGPDGKAKLLTDLKGVGEYVGGAIEAAKDDARIKDVARAWLRLAEVFHQDGFYTFQLVDEATKVKPDGTGKQVTARAVVMKGGNGELSAVLVFDAEGRLRSWEEKSKIQRGARPKCHATKLLDPDPVVRAIVEDDLLIMGRAARPYLDEQRAKASPELRRAIDRIWQRILDEDR